MNTEQLDKIEWLNRAFYANNKIKALEAVRNENKSIAERCTAAYENSGGSSGANDNSQEKILHKICDNNIAIQNEIEKLCGIRKEIEDAISGMNDIDLESILKCHYICYMTWEETAEYLGYSVRTVIRKHKRALDFIEI